MLIFDYFTNEFDEKIYKSIFIHNVGYSHNKPNYSNGYNQRKYYILHYILSGYGTYKVDGVVHNLGPGDGFLVPPDTTVIYRADKIDPWAVYWVGFSGSEAKNLVNKANLIHDHYVFHYSEDDFLRDTYDDMYQTIRYQNCPQELLAGYLYLIIGKLIRKEISKKKDIPLDDYHIAISFIHKNIYSTITIADLTNYVHISASQLHRIFIKNAGVSPYQYIIDEKMKRACELISKTNMPYNEIAYMLGFEYESHFSKLFHNRIGISPSEYRSRIIPIIK